MNLRDILKESRLTFVDVGARSGLPRHWVDYAQLLEVVAFEPDHEEAQRLAKAIQKSGARTTLHEVALWSETGRQRLKITANPDCSSLLSPNFGMLRSFPHAERFDVASSTDLTTTTLDAVLGAPRAPRTVFLKIDAQGGSLPILSGGAQVLSETIGVEAEVEFTPIYDGQSLHGEVDDFLRQRGFELLDLRPTFWRHDAARGIPGTRGQLIFADALYVASPGHFVERLAKGPLPATEQLCASAIVMCDVYRLPDRIVAYAAHAVAAGVDQEKRKLLSEAAASFAHQAGHSLPSFPFRDRLGLWLKDLGDYLLESRDSWANAEQRIGGRMRRANGRSALAKTLKRRPGTPHTSVASPIPDLR